MLGFIFVAPFILVLVVFALSNQQPVSLGFWPTDLTWQLPISLAVLGASAVFFVLGALVVGMNSVAQRRRARRAERRVRALEEQLETMRPRPVAGHGPGTAVQVVEH